MPRLGLLSWVMRVSTIYDWVAIGLFAALIVLFLQRSTSDGPEIDTIWHYLPPSIGCALVNYSGNEGKDALAIALLAGSRSEEHTSELQSLMRISYAVFCLKKKQI